MTIASTSKPLYGGLHFRSGLLHLILAEGDGVRAALGLLKGMPADARGATCILVVDDKPFSDLPTRLFPTDDAMLDALANVLVAARMGTRLYIAATAVTISRAMAIARTAGLAASAIQAECVDASARRFQCVHCKAIGKGARTRLVRCESCGVTLLVRDHYSRRIGAYQGILYEPESHPSAEDLERAGWS